MRALNLSSLVQRKPDRPTLKDRAASLKASAARVMRRKSARAAPSPDPVFEAIEAHRAAYAEWDRLSRVYNALPAGGVEFIAAYAKADQPSIREDALFQELLRTRATTPEGLRAFIEYVPVVIRQTVCVDGDSEELCALDTIREALRGLGDTNRLVSAPRVVKDLSPVSDLLADTILKEWAVSARFQESDGTPEGDAAVDRFCDRRDDLLKSVERLPATKSSLTAKTLALAWIMYVDLWSEGKARSSYATDGRLALDIHAIITGSGAVAGITGDPLAVPSEKPRPVEYAGLIDPAAVLAGLDVAALSMRDLEALHDVAHQVGELACAIRCQPRCGETGEYGYECTAAGHFMDWLQGATDGLLDRTHKEAMTRRPSDGWDKQRRLSILAFYTVQNGDPVQQRAFARALQAEARRISSRG